MKVVPSTVREARARKAAISRTRQYLAAHPEIEQQSICEAFRGIGVDSAASTYRKRGTRDGIRVMQITPAPASEIVHRYWDEAEADRVGMALAIRSVWLDDLITRAPMAPEAFLAAIDAALIEAPASARLDPTVHAADILAVRVCAEAEAFDTAIQAECVSRNPALYEGFDAVTKGVCSGFTDARSGISVYQVGGRLVMTM